MKFACIFRRSVTVQFETQIIIVDNSHGYKLQFILIDSYSSLVGLNLSKPQKGTASLIKYFILC